MHPFLRYATSHQHEIIREIEVMVRCESPTDSPENVNRFADLLVAQTESFAKPKMFRAEGRGRHLRLDFTLPGRRKSGRILGLGHLDTVWPLGTLKQMAFREEAGRLWGPGVLDMKAGLAFFIHAVRCLRDLDVPCGRHVSLLIVSDEETGSKTSRTLTEIEAQKSDFVLVLEPGTGLEGKLKTSRKGVGDYRIAVRGKAAHAGVDFANGASAIVEAAHQVLQIASWTDLRRGITVNPGTIAGGTRTNVIAAEAQIAVDVRIPRMRDADALDRKFRKLRPANKQCQLQVEGGLNRPPMERTPAIAALFKQARKLAKDLDVQLGESSTGGGSDGNFTAGLGIPTLDGLGAVGEGAHATNESVLVDRIADRVALLAALLAQPS